MLVLHHNWGALHVGSGETEYPQHWWELDAFFHQKFMGFMLLNRGFYPVWSAWFENYKDTFATMMTVFSGHAGYDSNGQWRLRSESNRSQPVQEFVDEHDGRAMLILLLCCNPRNRGRLTSQRSLVVYSRSSLNLWAMESRRSKQLLHVPGHGDFIGTTDEAKLNQLARALGYVPAGHLASLNQGVTR